MQPPLHSAQATSARSSHQRPPWPRHSSFVIEPSAPRGRHRPRWRQPGAQAAQPEPSSPSGSSAASSSSPSSGPSGRRFSAALPSFKPARPSFFEPSAPVFFSWSAEPAVFGLAPRPSVLGCSAPVSSSSAALVLFSCGRELAAFGTGSSELFFFSWIMALAAFGAASAPAGEPSAWHSSELPAPSAAEAARRQRTLASIGPGAPRAARRGRVRWRSCRA
mmetsp:Transcript_57813/g.169089  ORF Transcript_57813/g.169089 Transcript_57813/m.169089 type:complete len:220 (-) Transcript_57813:1-660(-)